MQNKYTVSTKRMTCEIVGLFLVFFVIFSLSFSFLSNLVSRSSMIFYYIISAFKVLICAFMTWKCGIYFAFRQKTILKEDLESLLKNLMIFVIILCLLITINNIMSFNKEKEKLNSTINTYNDLVENLFDSGEKEEYDTLIHNEFREIYVRFFSNEIILRIVHICVYNIQKKYIIDCVKNNN